jgi:hypothetical protein
MAGPNQVVNIAEWNGSSWVQFAIQGVGAANSVVWTLQFFDDGSGNAPPLFAGGSFATAGSVTANNVAKWDGSSWSAFGSGTDAQVRGLAMFDTGTTLGLNLYAGGLFHNAGGVSASYAARWTNCTGAPFCFGDGSGPVACPCMNTGSAGHGCDNSASTGGAIMTASGTLSPDTLVFTASGETANALSDLLQSKVLLTTPLVFGDGVRCMGGTLLRLFTHSAVGGVVSLPQAGDGTITARSAALGDPIAPGSTRYYAIYYRDGNLSFCPHGFNVSNAFSIVWP